MMLPPPPDPSPVRRAPQDQPINPYAASRPPAPGQAAAGGAGFAAGFGPRAWAKLIDLAAITAVMVALLLILTNVTSLTTLDLVDPFSPWLMGLSTVVGLLTVAYFVGFEATSGQTPGKVAQRLRVEGVDGEKPSALQVLKRNCYWMPLIIGGIPLLGSLASMAVFAATVVLAITVEINEPDHKGLHDRFADTRVARE